MLSQVCVAGFLHRVTTRVLPVVAHVVEEWLQQEVFPGLQDTEHPVVLVGGATKHCSRLLAPGKASLARSALACCSHLCIFCVLGAGAPGR